MSYSEVLEIAKKMDREITCDKLNKLVIVKTSDQFHVIDSGAVYTCGEYYLVFGEHLKVMVFEQDGTQVSVWKPVKGKLPSV